MIAKARALGIRCLIYLDDLVVLGRSKLEAARDWATIAGLMARELGLLFAQDKTETLPMQVFEALGFQWDCRGDSSPRCRLPGPKVKALRRMVQRIHAMQTRGDDPPCRLIARFLGVLESTRMACPEVKRFRGATQWCLVRALRAHGWEGKAHLRPEALTDLQQLLRRCGLTQYYFFCVWEVRFLFESLWVCFEDPIIGYFWCTIQDFLWIFLHTTGPRHGQPPLCSPTRLWFGDT